MNKKKTNVISVSLHKGGSGKSSVAANLGYALSEKGQRVLLIDTDSQRNLSHTYGLGTNTEKNFYKAFMNRDDIRKHIVNTTYENIDFVVSAYELAGIEAEMGNIQLREFVVRDLLKEVIKEGVYDYIIIDTNPSLGSLNNSILYGSDYILIPIEPTAYGVDGIEVFINHYNKLKRFHEDLDILGIVLNKIDGRRTKRNEIIQVIEGVFGDHILNTQIKTDSNIENSQWQHMPVTPYLRENGMSSSEIITIFANLADEVINITK